MTTISLRPYQVQALEATEQAEREGVRRPLIVHPTGTGKGVVMGAAAARRADRGRSLVLVHRQELADQFIEKLSWQAPDLDVGIVKAGLNQLDAPVVVASVDTVKQDKRLLEMMGSALASPFGTIIVDEAHHSPSPGWTKVLTGMGAFRPYGPLTIGFTATPERDGKTLGVWERVVHFYSIRQAIYDGNLVPILPAEVIETRMDLDQVRKTGGDYSGGDLGQALEDSGAIDEIADAYVEKASDRKGVAFTPDDQDRARAGCGAVCPGHPGRGGQRGDGAGRAQGDPASAQDRGDPGRHELRRPDRRIRRAVDLLRGGRPAHRVPRALRPDDRPRHPALPGEEEPADPGRGRRQSAA